MSTLFVLTCLCINIYFVFKGKKYVDNDKSKIKEDIDPLFSSSVEIITPKNLKIVYIISLFL
jgi:hypothetical protein